MHDGELIETNVNAWKKTLNKLRHTFDKKPGPRGASEQIAQKIEVFRPLVPAFIALTNKGLKPRHWAEISSVLSVALEDTEDLTITFLLQYHLQEHIQQIQDISERATKEYTLERTLDKMQLDWRTILFELHEHRETWVLHELDTIQQVLDDHLVKTQGMCGSPFVRPIESRVFEWNAKLNLIQDVIDVWIKCQVTWMYLEPIFSSDDINKQLPEEGARFQQVDTFWKTTMTNASRNRVVVQVCRA